MKQAKRIITKINMSTLFFIAVSFMSGTFAWFAFSGLSNVGTEIDIKAWNIEINKDGEETSNQLTITLPQISPGMETVKDTITITNQGDADALVKYSIKNARILDLDEDNYILSDTTSTEFIEDKLSHDYPFHINVSLSKDYVLSSGDQTILEVSVSWPLDSGNDQEDSIWGSKTYNFLKLEKEKNELDTNYSMRLPIEIQLELSAEQYVGARDTLHVEYAQNSEVFINPTTEKKCLLEELGCMKTKVIDTKNLIGANTVEVLPDFSDITYETKFNEIPMVSQANWKVATRPLVIEDILKIISRDVMNTLVLTQNLSDRVLGSTLDMTRLQTNLEKIKLEKSIIQFDDNRFENLKTSSCVWLNTQYSETQGYAIKNGQIYIEDKETICKVVPVITIKK